MNLLNTLNTLYELTTWKTTTELLMFLEKESARLPDDSQYFIFYKVIIKAIVDLHIDKIEGKVSE
jgi:hypothetical protein